MQSLLLGTLALVASVVALPTKDCCTLLAQQFPDFTSFPDVTNYAAESSRYWSSTCVLDPGCYFSPSTVEQVQAAVPLLTKNQCRFSVRAGGHSSIPGAANNNGGVTIAMTNFLKREVDMEKMIMHVGPGNRFYQLYSETDKYSVAPVVGRYGQVGTGLLLGAGLSFLNNAHGLAIDNVHSYEVVLADGRYVVASTEQNQDLYRALKGGGDNFAVIVQYNLRVYQRPQTITGGLISYRPADLAAIDEATYRYHVDTAVNVPDVHTLPQWGYNGATKTTEAFLPFYYGGQTKGGLPETMKYWEEIPYAANSIRNETRFENLAHENNDGYPNGQAQAQRTFSIYADKKFMKEVSERYLKWAKQWEHLDGFYILNCKMPITPGMIEEGKKRGNGENVLGLDNLKRPLSVVYFGLTINNKDESEEVFKSHAKFVQDNIALARKRGILHKYIMWNYAGWDQKVIASYGAKQVAFLKKVSRKYDPRGAFQKLVGGQKLP